ncbi:Zinc finger, C6HC-type [Artemisia annua]|uniref:RBR-type E3 ubiquitin transferase n=1 Tax=Artemisia annua TaxID=35608 RepID=A0A2U1PN69_ARTAN|nr:Zinc finger, C6HC-type [Artemisia annua]
MEVLERKVISSDFSWVKDGLYKLFRSRRVVLETKQTLFELHQDQLENFVEKLCNLLEEPFHLYDEDRIMEIRREVTNLSSVSDTPSVTRCANICWTRHFIVQINEGQSRRIICMAHECSSICAEAIARNLVHERHPDLADKFDRFLLESYIDENKMVKWCPSVPHCGNAVSVEGDELCEVECSCGKQFCFSCLSEAHSPCSCAMWALWKKDRDELEATINWITVNINCSGGARKCVHGGHRARG